MWFCTSNGVLYQDRDGFSRFTPADGLPHCAVKAVFQDREHQFWFATWGGVGLYDVHSINVFDFNAELSKRSEEGLKFYGIEDGLIDQQVIDLLLDRDGNLWIATLGGLSCFDGVGFRNFTTEDGLPSNRIHCLFEDSQGHLWLGTDGGVTHSDGQLFQTINSNFDIYLYPVSSDGRHINASHILRGQKTLSKHAAHGYWGPDGKTVTG